MPLCRETTAISAIPHGTESYNHQIRYFTTTEMTADEIFELGQLQLENTNLPKFRRTLWYDAYREGWAPYTEALGKELGLYTDPYQYLGMLNWEIHRAIRLVFEVGMHKYIPFISYLFFLMT